MGSPSAEAVTLPEEKNIPPASIKQDDLGGLDGNTGAREISIWIRALRSFFNPYNYPFPEASQADLLKHDWADELRIVHGTLLRCSQLIFQSINLEETDQTIFDETDVAEALATLSPPSATEAVKAGPNNNSLLTLSASLGDACVLCQSLLELRPVSLHAWVGLWESVERSLSGQNGANVLAQLSSRQEELKIPASLLELTRDIKPEAVGADILSIFSSLFKLLEYLRFVETLLRRDQPLKQALPIFTLVHQQARALADFIETRALRIEGLEKSVFETLDSTNYAITMELRKVFAHELVGVSSLQQAPLIYIKIENAHGLLRDSFQQSVVGLAQVFNPDLDGAHLFDVFQTKLEQSLMLRRDLWTVLQLVRLSEDEPEAATIERLQEGLASFRERSLHYLMFKDWESCERFMEEIDAPRSHNELTAMLHRFAAYLEALSSQVNMRAVLVNHPFDYPQLANA
jgi:hypothetical protein